MKKKCIFFRGRGGGGSTSIPNSLINYVFEGNVNDLAGNYDGVPTNITYEDGVVSKSGIFSDNTSIVEISNDINISEATVSFAIKLEQHLPIDVYKTGMALLNNTTFTSHYPFTDGNIYSGFLNATRQTLNGGVISDRTEWHVFTVTSSVSTGVYKVYQNATLIYTGTVSSFALNDPMYLGRTSSIDPYPYHFRGNMNEFVLFDYALTEQEVADLSILLLSRI